MKMFNHLKHLTLNKVYLKYFGIPQESLEVAQNPRQTQDKSGKQVWRKRYPKRVFVNSTNIPFFWIWPFWHPKRVTRVTRHFGKKYPFYAFSWSRVVYSHIVEWPPPPPGSELYACNPFWVYAPTPFFIKQEEVITSKRRGGGGVVLVGRQAKKSHTVI